MCAAIARNIGCSAGLCAGATAGAAASGCASAFFLPRRDRFEPDPSAREESSVFTSTGFECTMMPRPLHAVHVVENASSRPVPKRLRVICTRPSEVTSETWWRVRSRARASVSLRNTRSRLDSSTMSMKSTMIMPPMSRNRICRTISSAASKLLRVTVSSRLPPEPVNLPVFTSTTVIASVCSMISVPPDGSHTLRSSAFASCSSMRCTTNESGASACGLSNFSTRSIRSEATELT